MIRPVESQGPVATPSRATNSKKIWSRLPYFWVALTVFVILAIANTVLEPNLWTATVLSGTVASAAPLVLVALAETPVIVLGNGALDISVGPFMSVVNVVLVLLVGDHVTSPWALIGLALAMGLMSGVVNGFFSGVLRVPAIVVTFATYTMYSGLATHLLPQPGGTIPGWLSSWTGSVGPVPTSLVIIVLALLIWVGLSRTRFVRYIYAIGGDERASYVSGVPLALVRLLTFMVTGIFTALAALMLTAEIASGDGNIGTPFTLMAITAVALGGTSLLGGRGGIIGSVIGAFDIFLINNVITVSHLAVFWQDVAYGTILVAAVVVNALTTQRGRARTV
ncbi:MAG: ABC transporter permease [Firmicutes bacterium]|nr:ABC transporter permease [Bacillota bacterium]